MSENKGDLISREAALQELSSLCESWEDEDCTSYQALDIVENLPAVDAQPVVHGEWIHIPLNMDPNYFAYKYNLRKKCSACDYVMPEEYPNFNICPNCGAKMDGGSK